MDLIIEALKKPFEDKDWMKKLGYILIAYIAIFFIGNLLNFFIQLPLNIFAESIKNSNSSLYSLISSLSSLVSLGGSLLTLPLSIFIYGYLFDYIKNITDGKKEILPEILPIGEKLSRGIKTFALLFVVSIPSIIVDIMILIGTFISLSISVLINSNSMVGLRFLLIFFAFILFLLVGFANFFLSVAVGQLYITTQRLSKSLSIKNIVNTIKNNEGPLLRIFGFFLLTGFVQMGVALFSIFLLCITFIISPLITLGGLFVKSYILGSEFKKFKKLEE